METNTTIVADPVVTTTSTEAVPVATTTDKAPEVVAKTESKPSDSKNLAILARKEKQIYHENQKLKSEREKITKEAREFEQWKSTINKAKENPIDALEALGLSFEQVQEYVLNPEHKVVPETDIQIVRRELDALKQERESDRQSKDKSAREARSQELKELEQKLFKEATDFVKADTTKYELTNSLNQFTMVTDFINDYAEKTNKLLPFEAAADAVEKYLESYVDEQYKLISATKKFQAKVNPDPNKDTQPTLSPGNKTITNRMTPPSPLVETKKAVTPVRNEAAEEAARMVRVIRKIEELRSKK